MNSDPINGPKAPHFSQPDSDAEPKAWEEVAEGRFMPMRVRGSCQGRALG
ncbi:MAG: hypothetical protein P8L85_05895 [Rubripirellula sp.]|nr:hypothetical protein [Rubripirellula sp.]